MKTRWIKAIIVMVALAGCFSFALSAQAQGGAGGEEFVITSLEEFKESVHKSGLAVAATNGMHSPEFVDGFIILWPMEGGTWYVPVLEFTTPDAAAAFAEKMEGEGCSSLTSNQFVVLMHEEPDVPDGEAP